MIEPAVGADQSESTTPEEVHILGIGKALFKASTKAHVWLYRRSGGRLGGKVGGRPLLLLTTTGRHSRKRRTAPLMFLQDGEALLVAASAGGSPNHPGWYFNLEADPDVEVQIGRDVRKMRARITHRAERDEEYRRFIETSKGFAKYEQKTDRVIPVVALSGREDHDR